ncbi:MAG: hypothetical protein AAGJ93_03505 [Bacteroidota bacterium]
MFKNSSMDTKVTDGSIVVLGGIAAIQDYTGLLITGLGFVLISVLRIQRHRQEISNLRLDEELKRQQLTQEAGQ